MSKIIKIDEILESFSNVFELNNLHNRAVPCVVGEITVIKSNSAESVEDEFVLIELNDKFYVVKNCLGALGWHHVFDYSSKSEAIKDYLELIAEDLELKEYYESL